MQVTIQLQNVNNRRSLAELTACFGLKTVRNARQNLKCLHESVYYLGSKTKKHFRGRLQPSIRLVLFRFFIRVHYDISLVKLAPIKEGVSFSFLPAIFYVALH